MKAHADLCSGRGDEAETPTAPTATASSRRQLHRHRCAGFTLLELLISTAVGAIVLLVIQTTFFSALRLHNTTHERIDEDLRVHRALSIIHRDLAGLMLPGGTSAMAGHLQTENFSALDSGSYGERVSADLHTTSGRIDGYNPFAEVQRVAYYLAAAEGTTASNLVRVVTRNLLPVQETSAEEQVLLENVSAANLSYHDGAAWIDTWDSSATSTLPKALKFSVTVAPPEGSQTAPAPMEIVVPVPVVTTTTLREEEEAAAP